MLAQFKRYQLNTSQTIFKCVKIITSLWRNRTLSVYKILDQNGCFPQPSWFSVCHEFRSLVIVVVQFGISTPWRVFLSLFYKNTNFNEAMTVRVETTALWMKCRFGRLFIYIYWWKHWKIIVLCQRRGVYWHFKCWFTFPSHIIVSDTCLPSVDITTDRNLQTTSASFRMRFQSISPIEIYVCDVFFVDLTVSKDN
jgi:hypothetical protein